MISTWLEARRLPPRDRCIARRGRRSRGDAAEDQSEGGGVEGGFETRLDARQGQICDGFVVDRHQLVPNRKGLANELPSALPVRVRLSVGGREEI